MVIGRRIGRYKIVEKIGAGGMGEVFRAHDELIEQDFALKLVGRGNQGDEEARKRLMREAKLAASLNHPHICNVFEVGEDSGDVFVAMEYVAGRPLNAIVKERRPTVSESVRYATQIAEALAHAHARGVVHRDLKTANVVIRSDGWAKVLDFGLAKRMEGEPLSTRVTRSVSFESLPGVIVGTLPYMAPELLEGRPADRRSDIYAFGVLLYEMTTGRLPFKTDRETELIADILRTAPDPPRRLNASIPPGLSRIILKCLQKNPERRYATAEDLLADLRGRRTPWRAMAVGVAAVVAIAAGVVLYQRFRGGTAAPPHPVRVAVLPFVNRSDDPSREYFSDGLTDEMIVQLGHVRPDRLAVIGHTSVQTYKGTQKHLDEIGRELGVDYILEGSVRSAGRRVRITVQLNDPKSQAALWSETYDRDLEDILALQSEVTRQVSRALSIELLSTQATEAQTRPVNPEAYEAYLRGKDLYWKPPRSAAVASFERAIELDPGYGRAYAAYAYSIVGDPEVPAAERVRKAEQAAQRALELDPTLAEAWYARAFARMRLQWDFVAADEANQKALELGAGNSRTVSLCAVNLLTLGRTQEALELSRQAVELDPLSFAALNVYGYLNYYARHYDVALPNLLKAEASRSDVEAIHHNLGRCYLQMGRLAEARAEFKRSIELGESSSPGLSLAGVACTAIAQGRPAEASSILDSLGHEPGTAYPRAQVLAALGRRAEAIDLLERAFEERENMLAYIKVEPLLDPLRGEPRFKALVRRMRFPDA